MNKAKQRRLRLGNRDTTHLLFSRIFSGRMPDNWTSPEGINIQKVIFRM